MGNRSDINTAMLGAASKRTPKLYIVHTVVFLCLSMGIGIGNIVGKIGLTASDPIMFALVRDISAAVVLAVWAGATESRPKLSRSLVLRVSVAGFALFVSNVFFTVGMKISNALVASAWSATAPVITVFMAVLLGYEQPSAGKVVGAVCAVLGALFFTLYGQPSGMPVGTMLEGSLCFAVNLSAFALYSLIVGPLAKEIGTLTLTCGTFSVAAMLLLLLHLVLSSSAALNRMFCGPAQCPAMNFGFGEIFALVYFVVVYSVLQYWVVAWARQHLPASTINSYGVLQLLVSAAVSGILVASGFAESHPQFNITLPGWNALGGIGICIGVYVVVKHGDKGCDASSVVRSSTCLAGPISMLCVPLTEARIGAV